MQIKNINANIVSEVIVIIPTYNEKENISRMLDTVMSLQLQPEVLVIDDGSPDGTALLVKEKIKKYPRRIHIEERKGKLGLGTAYIHGFKWALDRGYKYIIEMDVCCAESEFYFVFCAWET